MCVSGNWGVIVDTSSEIFARQISHIIKENIDLRDRIIKFSWPFLHPCQWRTCPSSPLSLFLWFKYLLSTYVQCLLPSKSIHHWPYLLVLSFMFPLPSFSLSIPNKCMSLTIKRLLLRHSLNPAYGLDQMVETMQSWINLIGRHIEGQAWDELKSWLWH